MRTSLTATFGLALLLAGHAFAQDARQPSRQESFERDGIIWGSAGSPCRRRAPVEGGPGLREASHARSLSRQDDPAGL